MTLKILKVLEYPDRVALEYEAEPGYPQTFPSEAADDTCTWENLRLMLPPGAEREECIALAAALLAKHLAAQEARALGADLVALAQAVVEPEGAA